MTSLDHTGALTRHDWHAEWNYTLNPPEMRVLITDEP